MNIIKRNCVYYNWGGCLRRGYDAYPREFGARCECYNKFFERINGNIIPSCSKCINFKEDK